MHSQSSSEDAKISLNFGALSSFFIQGIGQVLPWNLFINADTYFATRFCGTKFQYNFENWFCLCYNGAAVIGLIVALHYNKDFSRRTKILYGLFFSFAIICGCTLLVYIVSISGIDFFIVTIVFICAIAVSMIMTESAMVGLASEYASIYMQAMMAGQGAAGLVVSVINFMVVAEKNHVQSELCDDIIGSTSSEPTCEVYEADTNTGIYFGIAALIVLACISCYPVIDKPSSSRRMISSPKLDYRTFTPSVPSQIETTDAEYENGTLKNSSKPVIESFLAIWQLALGLCITYTITLSLFPSVTTRIESMHRCDANASRFQRDLFNPITFIALNAADIFGRLMSGSLNFIHDTILLPIAIARAILIPFVLLCNIPDSRLPIIFDSDMWPVVFIILLGISNGFLNSRIMMAVPHWSPRHLYDVSGIIMVLFLLIGLVLGSILSFPLVIMAAGK